VVLQTAGIIIRQAWDGGKGGGKAENGAGNGSWANFRASPKNLKNLTCRTHKPVDGGKPKLNRLWLSRRRTTSCSGQQPVNKFQQV
jgi:hypothetical protein